MFLDTTPPQTIKLIGYWITSLRDTEYCSPQEFVLDSPDALRTLIADYLDRGAEYTAYRGVSWCRFFCGYAKMGNRELTDGYFVWPEGLSHYVRQHDVQLPEEFIRHVQSGTPAIPEGQWSSILDETYWKEWCRANASDQFRNRLQASLRSADLQAESLIGNVAAKMEATTGLSDTGCRWVDCKNRALAGKVLCARCILKG